MLLPKAQLIRTANMHRIGHQRYPVAMVSLIGNVATSVLEIKEELHEQTNRVRTVRPSGWCLGSRF
jgi:hypothetical protein